MSVDEISLVMFETALEDWPDQLPELGHFIDSCIPDVMKTWEELIESHLPTSHRTSYRLELRDHLPQFLKKLAADLIAGPQVPRGKTRPEAREHALQRWEQGWELEHVIRDYQMLYHAIVIVARDKVGRDLSGTENQNLTKLLQDAAIEAVRTYTAFRRKQDHLIENPDLGIAVLDNCSDAIIEFDTEGTILRWNKGAEKLYGYSADQIVGRHVEAILPPERQLEFERCMVMLRNGRDVPPFDTVRRKADGADVSVSISASPIRERDGKLRGFVSIARDISDRVRAAEALRDALVEAERASRAKSEFLANVSHELRTPMNAIIGMTELALEEDVSPELRDYLETTRESADLLLALVNDVLDISKLESGKFVLDEVNFSLRELIEETVRGISSRAYRKGLELAFRVAPNVPDNLHGDPLRLRQILTNLVGNAIKFTDEGEIIVEASLEAASGRSCVLRFAVSDTGIGISEEDQQRVFAPFTQADSSLTRRFAGTGLGLAIASHLINCFHGHFWLESELGVGSTFYFTARFALADETSVDQQPSQPVVEKLEHLPVLVADDNEATREIIGKLLSDWHMRPLLTSDADSALEAIRAARKNGHPIPVAVIDAIMPNQDGFALVEKINKEHGPDTKTILMLSSTDRLAFRDRYQELEYDALLEKPISQSNLLDAIVSALGVATVDPVRPGDLKGMRPPNSPLNVLLVEDTPANRKVVERVLAKRGHNVTSASNGREAIDLFHQHTFDVILMDVQMPSMDGFQATESIRKYEEEHGSTERVPIIAMTAHAMVGDRHRCLAAGMDDYISKPINIRRLTEMVESYGPEHAADFNPHGSSRRGNKNMAGDTTGQGVMDLGSALRRLDGDQSLLVDLIGFYLEDYPGLLVKMEELLVTEDAASLERAAHSMKGLVANFDAHCARDVAQRMEASAKQRDFATASGLLEGMKQAAAQLAEHLENYRQSVTPK